MKTSYTMLNMYCVNIFFKLFFKNKIISQKKRKKRYIYRKRFNLHSLEYNIKNALITNFFYKTRKKFRKASLLSNQNYFLKKYIKKRQKTKNVSYSKIFTFPRTGLVLKTYKAFTLKQRHFIVKNILMRRLFSFLLKNNKTTKTFLKSKFFKKKKVFLANMHKKLAWKMHKARVVHWNFSTKGQLNKYRYNKLLASVLFFLKKNSFINFLIFLLFSFYTFVSSYKQIMLLFKNNLIVYNGKFIYTNTKISIGDIIELPFGLPITCIKKKKSRYFFVKKLKTLTYRFLRRKHKKKIPKIYKKALFSVKIKKNYLAYDPTLNIIAIIDKVPQYNHNLNYELLKSSVVGLQNWRYEFQ